MSVPIVNAISDLGSTKKGGSGSHYFFCDDDSEYVVKFFQANTKTTTNELVAGILALEINLSAPDLVIVNISKQVLAESGDDIKNRKIQPGKHVGIKRLPDKTWDFEYWTDDLLKGKSLVNKDELYGVVCFDNWVINTDRDNTGNNMLQLLPKNEIRYWMVDFGHCFINNSWTEDSLKNKKEDTELMKVFSFIKNNLDTFQKFQSWFKKIENLHDNKLNDIVKSIPPSWTLSTGEKKILLEILKHRRTFPRRIISDDENRRNLVNN